MPRPPTREDLDYHLTTLFPPVTTARPSRTAHDRRPAGRGRLDRAARRHDGALRRPRGRRDGLPGGQAAGRARPARCPRRAIRCGSTRPAHGLADPELHAAAVACFAVGPGGAAPARRHARGHGRRRRVHRALCDPGPMPRRRSARPAARSRLREGTSAHDRTTVRRPAVDPETPPRARRATAAHRPGPHHAPHHLRRGPRPDRPALAADVPAGLGPGAHRQPGGAVAAAHGRRAGGAAARDRRRLRRLRAPARRAAHAAAAGARRGPRATPPTYAAGCWTSWSAPRSHGAPAASRPASPSG